MDPWEPPQEGRELPCPRPGHADLAGALKLLAHDARPVAERASARSTVALVAVGAVAKALLGECGVDVVGHVVAIGQEEASTPLPRDDVRRLREQAEASPVRCADPDASERMCLAIDEARASGDSLGGVVEVIATGVPPGLGGYAEEEARLDGRIAGLVAAIPSVKALSFGDGLEVARERGSRSHDPILYDKERKCFVRPTNRAGGLEGGVTNGEPVVLRAFLKPIPTLVEPLPSVNLGSKAPEKASVERSDVVAVPAAAVVAEAAVALVLADAFLERFGGDTLTEMRARYDWYRAALGLL